MPHCALPQATVQVTPALLVSLLTDAATLAGVLITIDEGGGVEKETATGGGGPAAVMVIDAETDLVLSVTEIALTVTVAGEGTVLGAVSVLRRRLL